MKKISLMFCALFVMCTTNSNLVFAQDAKSDKAPNSQLMVVHIDEVFPSMSMEYEKLSKQFIAEMTKHGIQDVTLYTSRSDENEYMWGSPVENMAQLDKKWYTELMEKMGKEEFSKMFDAMDNCYNKHYSIIVKSDYDLSMLPASMASINENPYRKFTWYYVNAKDMNKAESVAKEFKQLYTSAGLTDYNYIVHKPVYAQEGDAFIVMGWAKNKAEYDAMQDKVNAKVGDKRKELFQKLNAITAKKVIKEAEYLPGLSYEPRQLVKAK